MSDKDIIEESLQFLRVEQLRRGSHALSLLLRTDDTIVALNRIPLRGNQKVFYQKIKDNDENVLTIFRRNTFFNYRFYSLGGLGPRVLAYDKYL